MSSEIGDTDHHHVASRKRNAHGVRVSYPRKRAITACQLCRVRKTKCDNQRPACTSCVSQNVQCDYQDWTTGDMSSFDPASLAILGRLDLAIQMLQNQAHLPSLIEKLAASSQHLSVLPSISESPAARSASTTVPTPYPSDVFSPTQLPPQNGNALEDALQGAVHAHSVLDWPIFQGRINAEELNLAFYGQDEDREIREGLHTSSRGIREEDAPVLAAYFLQHVHIKNPILDPAKLVTMAKDVAEGGFQWDETSCLILIICGLAKLAAPFSTVKPNTIDSSLTNTRDYRTAEAYYTAARKRAGLLENTVLAVQCFFLLGVYQMYSMRPLKSWISFSRACSTFQTYLRTQTYRVSARTTRRLEQRLYWSCLKSECEMRDEVDLPPSGLGKVNDLDVFPSPPGSTPEPGTVTEPNNSPEQQHFDVEQEKSWYYYLSEIACRRLKNRISAVLHSDGQNLWQRSSLSRLHRLAAELDSQIHRWAEHVPGLMDSMTEEVTDELTYMLIARYLDMQELICRPFLFLAIHTDSAQVLDSTSQAYVNRAVDLHIKLLQFGGIKHRHHGSWYGARQQFVYALMYLAAVASERVAIPDGWQDTTQTAVIHLQYWEKEAPDLGVARHLLSDFRDFVKSQHNVHV